VASLFGPELCTPGEIEQALSECDTPCDPTEPMLGSDGPDSEGQRPTRPPPSATPPSSPKMLKLSTPESFYAMASVRPVGTCWAAAAGKFSGNGSDLAGSPHVSVRATGEQAGLAIHSTPEEIPMRHGSRSEAAEANLCIFEFDPRLDIDGRDSTPDQPAPLAGVRTRSEATFSDRTIIRLQSDRTAVCKT
jgi:hypothetical protein